MIIRLPERFPNYHQSQLMNTVLIFAAKRCMSSSVPRVNSIRRLRLWQSVETQNF